MAYWDCLVAVVDTGMTTPPREGGGELELIFFWVKPRVTIEGEDLGEEEGR